MAKLLIASWSNRTASRVSLAARPVRILNILHNLNEALMTRISFLYEKRGRAEKSGRIFGPSPESSPNDFRTNAVVIGWGHRCD